MLRHIVMVNFKDDLNKIETATDFKTRLLSLPEKIGDLISMEVGLNIGQSASVFDMVLIADFEDETGLNNYRVHPDHKTVLEFMHQVTKEVAVVDYSI